MIFKFFLAVGLSSMAYFFSDGLYDAWLLIWFAPIPLCLFALGSSLRATLLAGFLAYSVRGLSIVLVYLPTRVGVSMVIFYALFDAIVFALLLGLFRHVAMRGNKGRAAFVFALGWMSYEFVVSCFYGTTYSIAYTQLQNLPVIQIASVTGVWGIVFLLLFVPASVALMWYYRKDKRFLFNMGLGLLVFLTFTLGFGAYQLWVPQTMAIVSVGGAVVPLKRTEIESVYTNNDRAVVERVVGDYKGAVRCLGTGQE